MLILLPPSEGKAAPRRGKPLDVDVLSFPALTAAREQVIAALLELAHQPDAAARIGLGATQAVLVDLDRRLRNSPTARADQIYTGVLYDALDFASLSSAARRRAATRLAITSPVFGLVRATDRIPAYRLSGDVSLPGLGPVAGVWRGVLDSTIRETLGSGLLVDLRSSMYAAFWRPTPDLAAQVVTVRVLQEVNGKRQVVSHFNKATKGRLVRAVLEDGRDARSPDALAHLLTQLSSAAASAAGLGDAVASAGDWAVELGEPTRTGTRLDLIVSSV